MMEPGVPPPSGGIYEPGAPPPLAEPAATTGDEGLAGPLGVEASGDWFGEKFSLTILGKRLSADTARYLIVGLVVAVVVMCVVLAEPASCSVVSPCSAGAFCNFHDGESTPEAGDGDSGSCERCADGLADGLDYGASDTGVRGAGLADFASRCPNAAGGLPGTTDVGAAAQPGAAPSRPTYELTIGYW